MGQGNSKPTGGKDDKQNPCSTSKSSETSLSHSTSLGSKFLQLFTSQQDTATALPTSGYGSASPLPPSSSNLARNFRSELSEKLPDEYTKANSGFFLGKVLISPRRPLRDYKKPIESRESPLISGSNSIIRTSSFDLPTPRSVKRKAISSDNSSQSKAMRLEEGTSPFLRTARFVTSFVEEQEYDEIGIEASVDSIKATTEKKGMVVETDYDAHEEQNTNSDRETNDKLNDKSYLEDNELPDIDVNNEIEIVEDVSLMIPYSPSQAPKSMVSALNISLSSEMTCDSPSINNKRDNCLFDISEHETTDEELEIPTTDSSKVLCNDLGDQSEIDLQPEPANNSIEEATVLKNGNLFSGDIPVNLNDLAENIPANNFEDIINNELMDADIFEEENVSELEKSDYKNNDEFDDFDQAHVELGNDHERQSSEERGDSNSLPRAGTTDSSTISNKMLFSEFTMTESKHDNPNSSDSDHINGENENESSEEVFHHTFKGSTSLRSPTTEDAFYHHALAGSTFSSTISRMKWPIISMTPTSSISSLPIPSFVKYFLNNLSQSEDTSNSNVIEQKDSDTSDGANVTSDVNGSISESLPDKSDRIDIESSPAEAVDLKLKESDSDASTFDDSIKETTSQDTELVIYDSDAKEILPEECELPIIPSVAASEEKVEIADAYPPQLSTPKRSQRLATRTSARKSASLAQTDSNSECSEVSSISARKRLTPSDDGIDESEEDPLSLLSKRRKIINDASASSDYGSEFPHANGAAAEEIVNRESQHAVLKNANKKENSNKISRLYQTVALLREKESADYVVKNQVRTEE